MKHCMRQKRPVTGLLVLLSLITVLLLTSCARESSSPITIPVVVTPVLVEYDEQFLLHASEELEQLGPNSPVAIMVRDYANLRQRIRAMSSEHR